ncbi:MULTISPECIES: phosphopantetheine-binding protein [Halodesulfovibrio]|uniref:Acyl carrier protein n=1 Tax=Halodesulfovibrio marinisediminis DSM 17456 TaxID=1121457 RepID=A0A1N6EBQ5_9BACT|nr:MULTISPECIES: phosphopantetheine-binding protein [Halodesulfovibrio]SIN80475.1 acyl carrier protein [Halodesulfovibrio marinisediminis DSM 17456]
MSVYDKLLTAILDELYIEDISAETVKGDEPLFGDDGLGLDSLDAVELVVLVEKHFGVVIENIEEDRVAFSSLNALAAFIEERQA